MRNRIVTFDWNYFKDKFSTRLPKWPFGAKYILYEQNDQKFIIADATRTDHSAIAKGYLTGTEKILGGGCIYYYGWDGGKKIILTDYSVSFGPANHEEAKKILEEMFTEEVVVSIE
jgi:hypothetical protein